MTASEEKMVLVVDDDPNVFELVQLYVASDQVEVLQALDAYAGLDIAIRQQPDLIMLDVMMPGTDGLEMCRRVRDIPVVAATPVIILSAKIKDDDIKAGYEAGADDYVTKPFEPRELAIRIEEMMN
jgi:DNA-binding response OmpR family regulator